MQDARPEDFAAYVAARGRALERFAYLMSGDATECADLVQEALERAYPRWRGLVRLRFYEDLSYGQIAVILDCAEATARSRVHRALAILRTRVSEGDADA